MADEQAWKALITESDEQKSGSRAMEGGPLVHDGLYICILAHSLNQRYEEGISAFQML